VKVQRADFVVPTKHSVLFSAHFEDASYANITQYIFGYHKQLSLKKDAVPSIFSKSSKRELQGKLIYKVSRKWSCVRRKLPIVLWPETSS
jgi:hypothetical protein